MVDLFGKDTPKVHKVKTEGQKKVYKKKAPQVGNEILLGLFDIVCSYLRKGIRPNQQKNVELFKQNLEALLK